MNELCNKIMEQIDENKIVSLPRWRFVLLRVFFWLLAIISVIVGSLAVGAIFFLFIDYHQHGLFEVSHDVNDFLLAIPFVWIIIFVLFIMIAKIGVDHTQKGYKYSFYKIVFGSVLLSVIFGSILNIIGVGEMTHGLLNKIPVYNFTTYDSMDAWDRPNIGRLGGVVHSIKDNSDFSITDFGGHIWQIHLSTSKNNDSFIPELNSTVRMSGMFESSSNVFVTPLIYEWE
ncbi:MAG: hypothetical protein WCG28_01120 [bacterium]